VKNPDSVRIVEKTVTSVKSVNQEKVTLANQKIIQTSKALSPGFLEHLRRGFSPSQPSKKTKKNAKLQQRKPTEEEIAEARRDRERDARKDRRESPQLRFTPYAWAKLRWCCHNSSDECGGFGITPNFPDLVEDFVMLKQDVTSVTVEFEDTAVAEFLEDMVERGLQPHQCMRVWIHTHPNMNPTPSSVDEETFERVFGDCDYAIMFILSTKDTCYCRIQTNVGIPTEQKIGAAVDYSTSFGPSNEEAWKKEFDENVSSCGYVKGYGHSYGNGYGYGSWADDDDSVSRWANWSSESAAPAAPAAPAVREELKEVDGPEFFSLLSDEAVCAIEDSLKCEYKDDPALWDLAAAVMFHDDADYIDEVSEDTLVLLVKEEVRGPELAKLLDFDVTGGYGFELEDDDDDDVVDAYASGFASGVGGGLVTGFVSEAGDAVKVLPAKEAK
jgi:proteasome lid subunit RPN8/RPN11